MINLKSRGFWLRFIPIIAVIIVDIIFLIFLDNYFFINKRNLIQLSFVQWNEMLDQLVPLERELNKFKARYINDTEQYLENSKTYLEEHGHEFLDTENSWIRIILQNQQNDVYYEQFNLQKMNRLNHWKNSLFSQSFVGQVGKPSIYLLVEYATPPGIKEVEDLAWRYKFYALIFVLFTWVIYFWLVKKVVRPLIKVDQGIERIIRTGNVSLISKPQNETETAFNQLMRTQREVFFSVEVDHTVDNLHHISDEKEVIPQFLQNINQPIQKIYPFQSTSVYVYRNEDWIAVQENTTPVEIPKWTQESFLADEEQSLYIYIIYDEKLTGAIHCESNDKDTLLHEEVERIAIEIKKQIEQGIARCIGRSRQLTEERNRFGINIATNMGHDLTNIIASGKWDLDTISRAQKLGIVQTDEQRGKYYTESVDGLRNNLHFLQEMVDIYRSFAHTQKPRFEMADLAYLTQDLVQLFTRSTSKKLTINATTPEKVEAHVEPRLLRMTLFNLLNNAAQAIVQSDPPIQNGTINVTLQVDTDNNAVFNISDNGPGIRGKEGSLLSSTQISRIFQSGYSTKGKSSGGGLGLSWVRSIIEDFHNGSITANNHTNGGAVFTFSFPIKIQEYSEQSL